ncbi:MAG TPA: N-acetyltransferase [Caulobacteraceae bacterium]|nr:N-acetyltransferase [Caulobacteraceae bacterium]
MTVRDATPADYAAIRPIVAAAFGRDMEADIVEGVRAEGAVLVELVAEDGRVEGHVLFSRMRCDPPKLVAGMGPVSVLPERQDAGLGGAMIRAGIEACRAAGCEAIVLLGHPTYYPRFGFSAETARAIVSPYAGSPAFMAMELKPGALAQPIRIDFPAAFG